MDAKYIKIKKTEQQIINSKLQTFYDKLIEVFAPYQKYTMDRNEESWKERAVFCADKTDVVQDIFRSIKKEGWIPSFSKNSKNIITKRIRTMHNNLLIFEKIVDARECHFYPVNNGIVNFSIKSSAGAFRFIDDFHFNSEINFTAIYYEEDAVKIFDILYTDLYELLDWIAMELKVYEEEYDRHKLKRFSRNLFMRVSTFFKNLFFDEYGLRSNAGLTALICAFIIAAFLVCPFIVKDIFKSTTEEAIKSVHNINTPYWECTESAVDNNAAYKDKNQDVTEQEEQAENEKADSGVIKQETGTDSNLSTLVAVFSIIFLCAVGVLAAMIL